MTAAAASLPGTLTARRIAKAYRLPELNDGQAATIYTLIRERGLGIQATFAPLEVFPRDDKEDYLYRRHLQELVSLGLVTMRRLPIEQLPVPWRSCVIGLDGNLYRLRMTLRALAAYDNWAEKGDRAARRQQ